MELYVSKTSQQNMPVEFNIYYSRSKTLVGIVFWICMMGVFIALAVSMATDRGPKLAVPSLWDLFVAAVCYLLCARLAHF